MERAITEAQAAKVDFLYYKFEALRACDGGLLGPDGVRKAGAELSNAIAEVLSNYGVDATTHTIDVNLGKIVPNCSR